MKSHFPSLIVAGARLARLVSLALLPTLASEALAISTPQRLAPRPFEPDQPPCDQSVPGSQPYLAAGFVSGLRFQEAPVIPEVLVRPAAGAPPRPGGPIEDVAAVNRDSIAPPEVEPAARADAPAGLPREEPPPPASNNPPVPPAPTQELPILPDELQREVHPEDVLPFFLFPRGQSAPGVPAPGTVPPSSATYRQS